MKKRKALIVPIVTVVLLSLVACESEKNDKKSNDTSDSSVTITSSEETLSPSSIDVKNKISATAEDVSTHASSTESDPAATTTPNATLTPKVTPTTTATATTTPPTIASTETSTVEPTEPPSAEPTMEVTEAPTEPPTAEPTTEVTEAPTEPPTPEPTDPPTEPPTEPPTPEPTDPPTEPPTPEPQTYDLKAIAEEELAKVKAKVDANSNLEQFYADEAIGCNEGRYGIYLEFYVKSMGFWVYGAIKCEVVNGEVEVFWAENHEYQTYVYDELNAKKSLDYLYKYIAITD